jgi:hypothetical protein
MTDAPTIVSWLHLMVAELQATRRFRSVNVTTVMFTNVMIDLFPLMTNRIGQGNTGALT